MRVPPEKNKMKKVWAIIFKGELNRPTISREEIYLNTKRLEAEEIREKHFMVGVNTPTAMSLGLNDGVLTYCAVRLSNGQLALLQGTKEEVVKLFED